MNKIKCAVKDKSFDDLLLFSDRLCLSCFQPYFADVQFPESNFVNQIESLLKDPEEKAKFFQVFEINSICTHKYIVII